jgi:hypothetical protein
MDKYEMNKELKDMYDIKLDFSYACHLFDEMLDKIFFRLITQVF